MGLSALTANPCLPTWLPIEKGTEGTGSRAHVAKIKIKRNCPLGWKPFMQGLINHPSWIPAFLLWDSDLLGLSKSSFPILFLACPFLLLQAWTSMLGTPTGLTVRG